MNTPARSPGIHEQIAPDTKQRYTLSIPPVYGETDQVPLIVALHYGGTVTPFYGRGFLEGVVEPALRELNALIVAPDCRHGDWTNPASEAAVLALLDYLQERYAVDSDRTLVTGYSLGGAGTWYLAARHQETFSAAIPMAGWPQKDISLVHWQIPLYVIHSRADEVVPLDRTQEVVRQLELKGRDVTLVILEQVTHYATGRFVLALRAAVPWIQKIWAG